MKKVIAIALISAMTLSLASCSSGNETSSSGSSSSETNSSSAAVSDETNTDAASGEAKVGFYLKPTVEASAEETAFSTVYAAVMVDGEGKIIDCKIDATEFEPAFEDGTLSAVTDLRSKYEKGDDYGMVAYGSAIAEWYEQADNFAAYCVGKTVEEVRAIELDGGKATDADLSAGCTMAVTDFVEAVAGAADNAVVSVGASDKMGIALTTADGSDEESVELDTEYCVVTVDAAGKVTSCQVDVAQGKVDIENGAFVADGASYNSKKQLGDDYGMVAAGASTMEWYQQAEAFENYVVGKTADEVAGIALENGKATDADLSAGCTISISSILENTEKAIAAVE